MFKLRTISSMGAQSTAATVVRSCGIDEIPSLVNVLLGDMSIVGPRPFVASVWSRMSPEQRRRHTVPPGLTGWAQVRGRWSTTFSQRIERDLWYIRNANALLDLAILVVTPFTILCSVANQEPTDGINDDLPPSAVNTEGVV